MSELLKKRLGAIQTILLALLALGGIGWAAMVGLRTQPRPLVPQENRPLPAAVSYTGVLGLQADALAAVGVSSDAVGPMMQALRDYFAENGRAIVESIDSCNATLVAADNAERLLRAGKGDPEAVARWQTNLAQAQATKQALLDAAFNSATANLTEAQRRDLKTIKSNRNRDVPVQYLLANRSDREWTQLRDGLAHLRQAAEFREQPQTTIAAYVAELDANPSVAQARTRVEQSRAAIDAALSASAIR